MFDRLFMAELWCNMLLSLFCTVRFVLGMDLFLVSRFLSLGSVSCFFLFFRFRCSLPWLSPGLLPFLLPLLFLFCSPSFSLCWFPLGLCEFFMNWQSQACFRLLWSPGSHGTITFTQKIFKLAIIPRPSSHSTSTKLFNGYIFGPFMVPC